MISLKKYLDQDPDQRLPGALTAFATTLKAMGADSEQSCPATGGELRAGLDVLAGRLTPEISDSAIQQTGEEAELQLHRWGLASGEYFRNKAGEVKELLLAMSDAANVVADRDQRYASRLSEMTSRLQTISRLDDLTQIRTSLLSGAAELKACVEKMVQEGKESIAKLKAEVSTYEARLQEAENVASRDSLTGLYNRRRLEAMLEYRIREQRPFSLVMLDLENFKAVNDRFGHAAGDNLLKQFAYELRCSARGDDIVARWGGDEFVVVLDSDLNDAKGMMERMRHWFTGGYSIPDASGAREVNLSAAMGVAEWQPGESVQQIVTRAGRALYQQKHLHPQAHQQHVE